MTFLDGPSLTLLWLSLMALEVGPFTAFKAADEINFPKSCFCGNEKKRRTLAFCGLKPEFHYCGKARVDRFWSFSENVSWSR